MKLIPYQDQEPEQKAVSSNTQPQTVVSTATGGNVDNAPIALSSSSNQERVALISSMIMQTIWDRRLARRQAREMES